MVSAVGLSSLGLSASLSCRKSSSGDLGERLASCKWKKKKKKLSAATCKDAWHFLPGSASACLAKLQGELLHQWQWLEGSPQLLGKLCSFQETIREIKLKD